MNRAIGILLAVVGLVVTVVGLYPSGLLGRFNGVGSFGSGHTTADVAVVLGVVLLAVGLYGLIRRQPA